VNDQLHLDFETRSRVNIKTEGLDRYVRAARVLMLAWAFNDEEPAIWLPQQPMPTRLRRALILPSVTKVAWNARFERGVFKHVLDILIPLSQWRDPAVYARHATIPNSLADASRYLNLGDMVKHESGKALIRWFSIPKKDGTFREPEDHPEKFAEFVQYCLQDVRAERAVDKALYNLFRLTPFEEEVERIDAEINERGMPVDMAFVNHAHKLVQDEKAALRTELQDITGLANPNSGAQMLPWLQARGYAYSSLLKRRVDVALKENTLDSTARYVLSLRSKLSRSSTSKLDALISRVADDGRLRHSYKYLGANRTGRWSGEGVQLQNLPR
jgi:DNA polymerase